MMHGIWLYFLTVATCNLALGGVVASVQDCPARPFPNTVVKNPVDLNATRGALKVALTLRSREMMELPLKVCYVYQSDSGPVEAPTLRVDPGDLLELALTDRMTYVRPHKPVPKASPSPHDPCAGGTLATTSTNIDFDGLNLPPDCRQGEVSKTTIENTDPAFEYQVKIPKDNPPGMYLYHPHRQGSTTLQVNGGASGVLIVGGMETVKPEVAGLPERVLVIRQQFDEPDAWPPGEYRLSLNFQQASYPQLPSPVIRMRSGGREFWRLANATSQAFLGLQVLFGKTAQQVKLIAWDGVPVRKSMELKTIELPPGGRAEFTVAAPASGQAARLMQAEVETGRTGFENPSQELAKIVAMEGEQEPASMGGQAALQTVPEPARGAGVALPALRPTVLRKLYFAEAPNGTNGPTKFFLTVEGQTPRVFNASAPPAVIAKAGGLEDWIIANHSGEVHAFHMSRIHFLLLEVNGRKLANPELRDTVTVPAWSGSGSFPTVKLRLDFRDPRTAGASLAECHVLHHAEAGMMAHIQINP